MNTNRLILGIFGVGIAATFYVDALRYPEQAAQMPLIYSVAVGLLSLAMVGQELFSLRRRTVKTVQTREAEAIASGDEGDQGDDEPRRMIVVFIVFAMAIAYVAVISTAGYLLSTVAFMLASLWLIRTVSLKFSLIGIAVVVAVVCLVFIGFLGLPIPLLPTFV